MKNHGDMTSEKYVFMVNFFNTVQHILYTLFNEIEFKKHIETEVRRSYTQQINRVNNWLRTENDDKKTNYSKIIDMLIKKLVISSPYHRI